MSVCDHLNLLEKDYYGLTIWETPTMKVSEWSDNFDLSIPSEKNKTLLP